MRNRIQTVIATAIAIIGAGAGLAWVSTPQPDSGRRALQNEDPLPPYLKGTMLPNRFQAPFSAYFRVLGEKEVESGPYGTGTLSYEKTETRFAMRADWTMCPPFPGVPLEYFGKSCTFYCLQQPEKKNKLYEYETYIVCHDLGTYMIYAVNVGPLLPDLVTNYHQFDPHPPVDIPFASSRLPAPDSYSTANVEWFTTGGPPPASDQGYFAFRNETVAAGGTEYRIPYSFTGGHMGLKGNFYIQTIYDKNGFDVTPQFPEGYFDLPEDAVYQEPAFPNIPAFTLPQGSKDSSAPLNCVACHASN